MNEPRLTLRTVREAQGRSLREVAAAAGLDPGALSKIERGLREPRTSTLRKICAELRLERAEMLLSTFAVEREAS
jgi:transcriptional regulator with XRE-family HTH domain